MFRSKTLCSGSFPVLVTLHAPRQAHASCLHEHTCSWCCQTQPTPWFHGSPVSADQWLLSATNPPVGRCACRGTTCSCPWPNLGTIPWAALHVRVKRELIYCSNNHHSRDLPTHLHARDLWRSITMSLHRQSPAWESTNTVAKIWDTKKATNRISRGLDRSGFPILIDH